MTKLTVNDTCTLHRLEIHVFHDINNKWVNADGAEVRIDVDFGSGPSPILALPVRLMKRRQGKKRDRIIYEYVLDYCLWRGQTVTVSVSWSKDPSEPLPEVETHVTLGSRI